MDADFPQEDVLCDDSDLEDDSDDEAELMAELERIRKERAAEKAAREAKESEEQVYFLENSFLTLNIPTKIFS